MKLKYKLNMNRIRIGKKIVCTKISKIVYTFLDLFILLVIFAYTIIYPLFIVAKLSY